VLFKDRKHAGMELAEAAPLSAIENPTVVALPRGAVVVALELATALHAPLGVMPVEEIASPGSPEYVVGAVAENAIHVIDAHALHAMGVTEESLAVRVAEATARIASLSKLYRGDSESVVDAIEHRHVIVVDDGSASVPALEAVAVALARHDVDSLTLATPEPSPLEVHGYEQIISVERTAQNVEDASLIGLGYEDRAAPSDEVAAQMRTEYAANYRA
jgi:predicted phosphoribosyltransferase